MIVAFFGHRDFVANNETKGAILSILNSEIGENNAEFFLGGYGGFDSFAYSVCKEYRLSHGNSSLTFVTPYMTEQYQKNHLAELSANFDSIIYPEIEAVPKRFAISYRNRYIARRADLIICYVKREYGGAYQAVKYATSLGKRIINIASSK